jgi:hypothetical protein
MNFGEQIIATFIGALFAFVFSIGLFYLTEKWKNRLINKNLFSYLEKELGYNITFLEKYIEDYEKMIRKITANDKQIYTIFKFEKLQRLFLLDAFSRGELYKCLTNEDISNIDEMLTFFGEISSNIAWSLLDDYKKAKKTQQEVLSKYEWDRDQIIKYRDFLIQISKKLKK